MKRSRLKARTNIFVAIFMVIFTLACVYPFYYIIILSFNDSIDSSRGGIYLWVRDFTLANYKIVFQNQYLLNSFYVSITRVLIMGVAVPLVCSFYGYAVSKTDLVGRKFFSSAIIIPMYIGGGLIPFYFVLRALRLYNTFAVYIIPYLFTPFYVLLFRSYFQDISLSLREAAIIDGAGEGLIFFKIIIPVSIPVFTAVALFTAVGNWNEWMIGQLFISDSKLYPMATILLQILRTQSLSFIGMSVQQNLVETSMRKVTPESVRLAMIVVVTAPILLVYPFLQKYFMHGIMIGAVKG